MNNNIFKSGLNLIMTKKTPKYTPYTVNRTSSSTPKSVLPVNYEIYPYPHKLNDSTHLDDEYVVARLQKPVTFTSSYLKSHRQEDVMCGRVWERKQRT